MSKRNILEAYPYELLEQFVSYLAPTEVVKLLNDNILQEHVLRKCFNKVGLYDGNAVEDAKTIVSDRSTNVSPETILKYSRVLMPYITKRCTLRFSSLALLREVNETTPKFLQRFGKIENASSEMISDTDLEQFSHWESIRSLPQVDCKDLTPANLPPNLTSLGLKFARITEPLPPDISELCVSRSLISDLKLLPASLKKLRISSLKQPILFANELPNTLTSLEINGKENCIESLLKLDYLPKLENLVLDRVACDFKNIPQVVHLEIRKTLLFRWVRGVDHSDWPQFLKSLTLSDCEVSAAGFFSGNLPQTLEKLHYININIILPGPIMIIDGTSRMVKIVSLKIPSNVTDFKFSIKADVANVFLRTDTVFPKNLRILELYCLAGFFHEEDWCFNSFHRVKFPPKLRRLGLHMPNIKLPEDFLSGTQIDSLHLVDCGLNSINLKHTKLTELYLRNNLFQSISQLSLPETLLDLDLSGNELCFIDCPIPQNLVRLDLGSNKLAEINAADFANLSSLIDLNISHNEVNRECVERLRAQMELTSACVVHTCGISVYEASDSSNPCLCYSKQVLEISRLYVDMGYVESREVLSKRRRLKRRFFRFVSLIH